jgi:hypothetical protein
MPINRAPSIGSDRATAAPMPEDEPEIQTTVCCPLKATHQPSAETRLDQRSFNAPFDLRAHGASDPATY